ncbi:MAG: hypothetical protein ABI268_00475 [Rhodanobacter sp.]
MRSLSILLLILALPLVATAQSVGVDSAQATRLLAQQQQLTSPDVMVPLWYSGAGRLMVLKAEHHSGPDDQRDSSLLGLRPFNAGDATSAGLQYGVGPGLQAHAEVSGRSWLNSNSRVLGSEVGAIYDAGGYRLGLSVGSTSTPHRDVALPRVLPGAAPGIDGLASFDSSAQINALGRLSLGRKSGIDLGASMGRIHLLPGNLLGVSVMDQKALSVGVDHGPLSGMLIGRTMQPEAGIPGNLYTDKRWNSLDLGVTWRLPWRGSLSVGAQNLWSSGTPANTPVGPEPDQSRTPYVQYHQDL